MKLGKVIKVQMIISIGNCNGSKENAVSPSGFLSKKAKLMSWGKTLKGLKYITVAAIFTLFSWARQVLSKRGKLGIKVML